MKIVRGKEECINLKKSQISLNYGKKGMEKMDESSQR
jgi:hypothetical protein